MHNVMSSAPQGLCDRVRLDHFFSYFGALSCSFLWPFLWQFLLTYDSGSEARAPDYRKREAKLVLFEKYFLRARTFLVFIFFMRDFPNFLVWSWNARIRAYSLIFGGLWEYPRPIPWWYPIRSMRKKNLRKSEKYSQIRNPDANLGCSLAPRNPMRGVSPDSTVSGPDYKIFKISSDEIEN